MLLSRGMVRLVVIDSVAAPFRCEFDGPASAPRARCLQALGATLRQLSYTFQSPVLCVNQVGRPSLPLPYPAHPQRWVRSESSSFGEEPQGGQSQSSGVRWQWGPRCN